MPDDMYFSKDERSLYRGKRHHKRTITCRPCIVRTLPPHAQELEGIVLDVNPNGMLIRTMVELPLDSRITVQLMRDDQFREAFSAPLGGRVVRHDGSSGGFTDHGILLERGDIRRSERRPIEVSGLRRPSVPRPARRMHSLDITVGETGRGR